MSKIKNLDDLNKLVEGLDDDNEEFQEEETVNPEPKDPEITDPDFVEETKDVESVEQAKPVEQAAEETPEPVEENAEEEVDPESVDAPYEPNLKYKAMKSEYDLPDYLKSVIDSPEKEEEIKKVYSKAMGMDHFAAKNETMKKQLDEVAPIMSEVNTFNQLLGKKQYHSAFKMAGIGDEDILKLASDIIEVRELTPEQRAAYNNTVDSNQRQLQLEAENQRLREQYSAQSDMEHVNGLETELVDAETNTIAQQYDQRIGRAGAFREAVINNAAMIEFQTKDRVGGPQILSPKEAVQDFIQKSGIQPLSPTVQGSVQQQTNVVPPSQRVVQKKVVPTIPNLQGGGTSPVKKKVKTLADLHKLAEGLDEY